MGASLIIIMNAISNAEEAEKEAKEKEKQRKLEEEETRKYEAEQRKKGLVKVKYLLNPDKCYTHSYRNMFFRYSWLYTKDSGQPYNPGYKYLGYEYKPWYGEKWVTKEESKKYVAV